MTRKYIGWMAMAWLLVGRGTAFATEPVVMLKPAQRDGHVTPDRHCSALTGGGAVTVQQPAPDTLVINLTGVAAAKANPFTHSWASLEADVEQQFEVVFPAGVKPARLVLEGRVLGLLRSEGAKSGSTELAQATAAVHDASQTLAEVGFPSKCVNGREALAVNLAEGPVCVPVGPGCLGLHMLLRIRVSQGPSLCPYIASAEFAPPPALPPTWIHSPDPFGGVDRSGLGFQVTLRVEPVSQP